MYLAALGLDLFGQIAASLPEIPFFHLANYCTAAGQHRIARRCQSQSHRLMARNTIRWSVCWGFCHLAGPPLSGSMSIGGRVMREDLCN